MARLDIETDVLVIGAGPTGLALATALCKRGLSPTVIDANPDPAHTSRAAVVHARTLEVLEALEVSDQLLERGVRVPDFRIRDRDHVLLHVDFRGIPSRYNYTLMCPQDQTETVLRDRLASLGGSVRRGCRASDLSLGNDDVTVSIEEGGRGGQVRARYVVGADGMHSLVRERLQIPFEGATYAQSFVLADVLMDWPLSRDEVSLFFSPEGLVVVAPLPQDHVRIVATVDDPPEVPSASYVQALLDSRGPKSRRAAVRQVVWGSRFLVHHRVASQLRLARALLAGDAAHVHSPAGGQGMNTGIQDALALAEALSLALQDGHTALLDSYSEDRRKVARHVVQLTDWLTTAATVKGALKQGVRNAALTMMGHVPPVQHAIARNLAELDNA